MFSITNKITIRRRCGSSYGVTAFGKVKPLARALLLTLMVLMGLGQVERMQCMSNDKIKALVMIGSIGALMGAGYLALKYFTQSSSQEPQQESQQRVQEPREVIKFLEEPKEISQEQRVVKKPTYEAWDRLFWKGKTGDELEVFMKEYGFSPEKLARLLGAYTLGELSEICDVKSKAEKLCDEDLNYPSHAHVHNDPLMKLVEPLVFIAFHPCIAGTRPLFSQALVSALKKLPAKTKCALLNARKEDRFGHRTLLHETADAFCRSTYILQMLQDSDFQDLRYAELLTLRMRDMRLRTAIHLLLDPYIFCSDIKTKETHIETAVPFLRMLLNPIVLKEAMRNKVFGQELSKLQALKDDDDKTVFDLAGKLPKYDGRKKIMAKLEDALAGRYIDEAAISTSMCERLKAATQGRLNDVSLAFYEE